MLWEYKDLIASDCIFAMFGFVGVIRREFCKALSS